MTGAIRYDSGKGSYNNIHPEVLASIYGADLLNESMVQWYYFRQAPKIPEFTKEMFDVLDLGAKKYAVLNYTMGMNYSRVFNSWFRHKYVYEGELDKESGLPHAGHIACNELFAYTYFVFNYDGGIWDDRPKEII